MLKKISMDLDYEIYRILRFTAVDKQTSMSEIIRRVMKKDVRVNGHYYTIPPN